MPLAMQRPTVLQQRLDGATYILLLDRRRRLRPPNHLAHLRGRGRPNGALTGKSRQKLEPANGGKRYAVMVETYHGRGFSSGAGLAGGPRIPRGKGVFWCRRVTSPTPGRSTILLTADHALT